MVKYICDTCKTEYKDCNAIKTSRIEINIIDSFNNIRHVGTIELGEICVSCSDKIFGIVNNKTRELNDEIIKFRKK